MTKNYIILSSDLATSSKAGIVQIDTELSATSDNVPTNKVVTNGLNKKQAQHTTATATLTVAGWDSTTKRQQVSVSGVTASNTVIVSPSGATYVDYNTAQVHCVSKTTGALTFECTTVPTNPLVVDMVIME